MNTNLKLLPQSTVEEKLTRMKALSQQIKEAEAEYNMLKSEVIKEYFLFNPEYCNYKGLLLASYKPQDRSQFNATRFKNEHEDVYKLYTEIKTISVFLLK